MRFQFEDTGIVDLSIQFLDAVRSVGLEPPSHIEPGRFYRFPGVGKGRGNTAGWCKLFEDGQGGCFGDWSSGLNTHWQAKQDGSFSRFERAAFMRRVNSGQAQAEAELRTRQVNSANRASAIWKMATPAPGDNPYLIKKAVEAHGARLLKGLLVLPVTDFTGKLTSLQFIDSKGRKRLLSGGRKRGCFILVSGDMAGTTRVIICEGWATGCTLAESDPAALVLAAIDAGNLNPVALAARQRWPAAELVIAGDDDRQTTGNPGASKAKAAAIIAGALLALPPWPTNAPETLTDFNDLAKWLERREQ